MTFSRALRRHPHESPRLMTAVQAPVKYGHRAVHLVSCLAESNARGSVENLSRHFLTAVRGKVMHEHRLRLAKPEITRYLERREYLTPVRILLGAARRLPACGVNDVRRRRQVRHFMTFG